MTDVTVGTRNVFDVVWAAMPAEGDVRIVTIKAHAVLDVNFGLLVRTEFDDRWAFLPAPDPSPMVATGAVACFALQLSMAERAARVRGHGMFGTKDGQCQRIVMTGDTGIGALSAVGHFGIGGFLRLCSRYGSEDNAKDKQSGATAD